MVKQWEFVSHPGHYFSFETSDRLTIPSRFHIHIGHMNRFLAASLVAIGLISITMTAQAAGATVQTRFGELKTNDDAELLFKGQVIPPGIILPDASGIVAGYKLDGADVFLIRQLTGGDACPGLYVFLTVKADSATATPEFGTCHAETISPEQEGQTISFSMTNLEKHGKTRFTYDHGTLLEDGKPHR